MYSDNRLLAEFLGWKYVAWNDFTKPEPDKRNMGWYEHSTMLGFKLFCRSDSQLPFTRNWNYLMKVIDKIESIRHPEYGWFMVSVQSNVCHIHSQHLSRAMGEPDIVAYMSDPNAVFPTKIESVWYNCVQFVKFYDENLKNA